MKKVKNTSYEKKLLILVVIPSKKPGTASDGCEDICFSHEKCEKQISSHPSEIKKKTIFQSYTCEGINRLVLSTPPIHTKESIIITFKMSFRHKMVIFALK